MLRFSDGMNFDTSGPMRVERRRDGYYVVGDGMMLAVDNREDGQRYIDEQKAKTTKPTKKLRDWLPKEALDDPKLQRLLDKEVTVDNSFAVSSWPGPHKNVFNWCVIDGGIAVGWNENPSRGWSFPTIRL